MHQVGHALGGLNSQPVGEVGLGVLLLGLQAVQILGGLLAHGHGLQGDYVAHAAVDGSQVVGQAQQSALVLAGELEARGLVARLGVEDDHGVAVAVRGEVPVGGARNDPAVVDGALLHVLATGQELLGHDALELGVVLAAPAPRHLVERLLVHAREHLFDVEVGHAHRAPEGRLGHGGVVEHHRLGGRAGTRLGLGHLLVALRGLVDAFLQEYRAVGRVLKAVHRGKPVEGVLAVEHPACVRLPVFEEQRAPPELAVDGRAADEHGVVHAARGEFLHQQGHLLAGAHQQRRHADDVGLVLHRGVDDCRHRHLTTEVVHRVAVVLEDRAHEVLADVVHVAVHRGHDDRALGVALHLVEVLLDVGHALLHDLGALQHVGEDELATAEAVAHFLHGGQQHLVEHLDGLVVGARAALVERLVDVGLHALGHPVQDALEDDLVGRQALEARRGVGGLLGLHALVLGDEAGEGILAPGEDEVVGQLHLVGGNLAQRAVVRGVDHRQVEPGIHGTGQEHAVQRGARGRRQPERHVAHAQAGVHARELLLDQPDALDGGLARLAVLLFAGGQREGEGVEDERAGVEPVLAHHDVVDLLRHAQLFLGRLGHADLVVDGQRHHGRAVLLDDRHDLVDLHPAVLHVDGVHDGAAGVGGQRGLHGVGLGAVDHQRGLDAHGQLLGEDAQLLGLVNPLGQRHADVQHVRAELHLLAGNGQGAVVVVREDHLLDLAAALRVHALAHDGGAGLLAQVDGPHGAGHARGGVGGRVLVGRHVLQRRHDGPDVVGRAAAAATHHVGAEVAHHRGDLLGHLIRAQVVVRHAAHVAGQAGVGHNRDGLGRVAAHVADRLAQVLGAHGAVGADDIHAHGLEDGDHRTHVGTQQHAAGLVERHLRLNRHGGAHVVEGQADAVDCRPGLEDVLLGLDEQHVCAALHQANGLRADLPGQLVERDARQLGVVGARQHSGGADGPDDEPGDAVCGFELVARLARNAGRGNVDVGDELGQVAAVRALPLLQANGRGLERVGLHGLRPGFEVRPVDLLQHIRPGDGEVVHGTLERPAAVVVGGEVACLDLGAQPAVEHDDALLEGG